ncbi:MAG: DUF72 domain-containing protein [Candidatus Bathyarchaeota archaeon]|nr:DUF72 domain-containing protein [Candidatus Bathyarchaeota archaeon]MDH5494550.1 DUF72 domain-containing protein [Candidatus Bathyarchaeota archaeon]
MTEYLIGTGGWAYFKIPNKSSLKAYSEVFDFVEVNYTFYEYPSVKMVERWRRTVPSDFTFTVRCHRDLTHRIGLKPVDEAYAVFSRMISICKILEAPFLHLLTPASYVFDDEKISQVKDLFSSIDLKGVRLAWEIRSQKETKLANIMRDFEIVHSIDLSRENPSSESDTIYSRVFGKGKHNIYQFTDDELKKIDRKAIDASVKMAIITWHGVKMTSDAARFKKYKETGNFLPVTAYTGVDSARAVLKEDARFPSTKAELIENQGWKVIDLTAEKRVHLSELLNKIHEKTYSDVKEVTKELKAIL